MSTFKMMKMAFAVGTALACAAPANAAVLICLGGGCAGPNPASNVLFNDGVTGTSINAGLNGTPGTVNFSSIETLETIASGQARITAFDGVLNNPLTITYADGVISRLEFNINARTDGDVTFTFAGGDSDGVILGAYGIDSSGSNFFNTFNGTFRSVTMSFSNGATVDDLRQIRVTAAAAAVPEPATWALMLMGFGAIGASLRMRKKRAMPAFA